MWVTPPQKLKVVSRQPPAVVSNPIPQLHLPPAPPSSSPRPIVQPPGPKPGSSPVAPPVLRRPSLPFDPSLISLESQEEVCDWLSGRGGVSVPGGGVALPYLPPFVSTLSTLSALLRTRKSLITSSQQLLSEPRRSQLRPQPDIGAKNASNQQPDLPDSTSDRRPAPTAPSASSAIREEELQEADLVRAVRQLVAERLSGNPAYQLLKARFLSSFTVPALLATMQPIKNKGGICKAKLEEEEDEEEEEEEEQDSRRQTGSEESLLLSDGSGAPANHFSGITSKDTPQPPTPPH